MESSSISTDQLIELLYESDPDAYGLFYDTYSASIHGNILELISDKDLAVDILLEVFKTAYKTIKTFDRSKSTLYRWLFNLAQSHCYTVMRKIQAWPTPEEFTNKAGMMATMLNNLPEGPKYAMQLQYYKGYSHKEIAELMQVSIETVKGLLKDAHMHIRAFLENQRCTDG